jgi:recombination protein RecA
MSPELEAILKSTGLLSDQELDLGTIDSGSYSLNRILSGDYQGGYPIGGITEIIGESSVGKTGFLTHLFKNAQEQGCICAIADNEYAYSPKFADQLGVDATRLVYFDPSEIDTAPKCFNKMEHFIKEVREVDQTTPIVIALDSMGTMQSNSESEQEMEGGSNMDGAIRAKEIGRLLRKFNPLLRKYKVCCVFINQYRAKPNVMYGDPRTRAGGGKSLEFYCAVSLEVVSNKTSDIVLEDKVPVAFKGKIRCKKNKTTIPYQECEFYFDYSSGLDRFYGLSTQLVKDKHVEQNGAWYTVPSGAKFQSKQLEAKLEDNTLTGYDEIKDLLGIPLSPDVG